MKVYKKIKPKYYICLIIFTGLLYNLDGFFF